MSVCGSFKTAEAVYLTAGGIIQGAGGKASQVTEVLKEVQARHADGFWFQLGHLETESDPSAHSCCCEATFKNNYR